MHRLGLISAGRQLLGQGKIDVFGNAIQGFDAAGANAATPGAATPNFGKEILQEGIKLTAARIADAGLASSGALYVGTASGGLVGQLNLFSGGAATVTDSNVGYLGWSEVGIMTLTPSVGDGDYLGAGDVTGSTTGSIGRFYPAAFALSPNPGALTTGCAGGGFTYMGQPFTIQAALEARNSLGGKVLNYHGAYANGTVSFAAENADSGTNLGSRLTVTGAAWNQGNYDLGAASATFSKPTSLTADATWGKYDSLKYGAKVTDSDAGTSPNLGNPVVSALDMNPTTTGACAAACTHKEIAPATIVRFGRLALGNAYGSELLPLLVPVTAQYYSGGSWLTNTLDNCTAISSNAVVASGGIAANTCFLSNPLPAAPTNASCLASSPAVTLASGKGNWIVFDKTTALAGFTDLTLNLSTKQWLQGTWTGAATDFTENPVARVRFGSPRAPYIYLRERY